MSKLCKETMIRSYARISFHGEKRGASDYEYYTNLLANDLKELESKGNTGNYEAKFISKIMDYYHSQSNCASAFIVGPARFNNRQAEKRFNARDNKLNHFDHWRTKYFRAVNRVRTLSPEAEIDKTIEEITGLEAKKELYKEVKKQLGKLSSDEEKRALLVENFPNMSDFNQNYIIKWGLHYQSITTKIRERKKKIQAMQHRIETKASFEPINFDGGSIYIENDRVIISHDEKPEREIIQAIKKHGFRWSTRMGNWCRKHTGNALNRTMDLLPILRGESCPA